MQPATSAGPIFAAIWCSGMFHGVIATTTPAGARSTSPADVGSRHG